MKNVFYFTLKALFVLKIFKFLSLSFVHVEKKARLEEKGHFKIHDITTWLKIVATYISLYMSRSKRNKTMKLG